VTICDNYGQVLIHFVAFLLWEKGNYRVTLPPDVTNLITEFKEILPPSQLSPLAMTHRWDVYSLKLIKILISVWTRSWDPCHSDSTNIWDPTVCFITLTSIKADHSWAQAIEITPIIARMTYCMRTIFLMSLHIGDMETAIVCERHHNLKRWHYKGNDSTFHSLCSLQHLASKIALSTPSFPAFIWYDDVTPYKLLGQWSDILNLNWRNNQLERRARPPQKRSSRRLVVDLSI